MKRLVGLGVLLAIIIAALSGHGKSTTTTSVASQTPAPAVSTASAPPATTHHGPPVHYTRCDQNISVGPATTCGFADNVFRAFASKGSEAATLSATSPATGKTYAMRCHTSSGTTDCTGGKSARVRFPLYAAQIYNQPAPQTEPAPSASAEEGGESEPEPEDTEEPEGEPECTNGSYTNSSGNTVCSPEESSSGPPAGATAECEDGTYSFSEHHSGTCSGHGGVRAWL